ncbi:MAG TPA: hypothetical protein VFW44_18175 [Bryobacteraceae bacterium]|nr:hypothetical protein [Bryobacteraceae bacterium]
MRWLLSVAMLCAPLGAQPDLKGVYQAISNDATLAGGLKNSGSPSAIQPASAAAREASSKDPWKMCQPVGPFRMMAVDGVKIELAPTGSMIVMLFEDLSHGLMRTIYTKRGHPEKPQPTWMGDSVGHWEGDTLVVDTVGFNGETWLNGEGAQHSEALHLIERIRPISGGRYLEYKVTAEDPRALAKPYTYTRYFQRLDSEIVDDICRDQE